MDVTSRRGFLKIAAAGAAGAALTPALGRAAGKTVTLLHESSFIPPFDEYMKNVLAPAYEKETGVKIVYEIISVGSSPARIASISETGTGADITMNLTLIPFLYDEKYADVGDIAEEMGKEQGGWYPAAREMAVVNGKWKAIPFCSIGQLMNWRSDWFAEVGFKEFPETWDELYEAGKKLKAKGHPFGFELGHGFGDNHGWLYPLLWSYGAHEVSRRRQDDHDRFRRDRARRRFRPEILPGYDVRGRARLDRPEQQQGVDGRADLLHQQCREHSLVCKGEFSRDRQGHPAIAEPGRTEGPLPFSWRDQPFDLQFLSRRRKKRTTSCGG